MIGKLKPVCIRCEETIILDSRVLFPIDGEPDGREIRIWCPYCGTPQIIEPEG